MKGPPPSAGELGSDTELTFGERTRAACSLEGAEPGVGEIFAKIGWKVTCVLLIVQHIFVNLEPGGPTRFPSSAREGRLGAQLNSKAHTRHCGCSLSWRGQWGHQRPRGAQRSSGGSCLGPRDAAVFAINSPYFVCFN